jgi:hypothetical protein
MYLPRIVSDTSNTTHNRRANISEQDIAGTEWERLTVSHVEVRVTKITGSSSDDWIY